MKMSHEKPAIYPIVKFFFPAAEWGNVIITWGDTVYCAKALPQPLLEHEALHTEQQLRSKLFGIYWWIRYIASARFRLSQEIPAHRLEYRAAIRGNGTRQQARYLDVIAGRLAGPLYGNLMTLQQAKREILYPHI